MESFCGLSISCGWGDKGYHSCSEPILQVIYRARIAAWVGRKPLYHTKHMAMISRISVKLNDEQMAALEEIMHRHGFNRSEALRYVIRETARIMGVSRDQKTKPLQRRPKARS